MVRSIEADGLRGLAALNVVLCHYVAAFAPTLLARNYGGLTDAASDTSMLSAPPATLFYNGHFAVMVFFVLSGWVLSAPAFVSDRRKILSRLIARPLRLGIPTAAASAGALLIWRFDGYFNGPASQITGSSWLSQFYDAVPAVEDAWKIVLFEGIALGDGLLIPPIWTLAIELWASVLLLVVLLFTPKRWILVGIGLYAVLVSFAFGGSAPYYLCFASGALLHSAPSLGRLMTILLALVGCYLGAFQYESIWYFDVGSMFGIEAKDVANALGASALVWAVVNGFGGGVLRSQPVQFLGEISYALHLIHFPLLCSLGSFLVVVAPANTIWMSGASACTIALTFWLAWFFTRYVDAPAVRWARAASYHFAGRSAETAKEQV